ncbi:unnamed protein product [Mytilus coruscus]|uniref:DDE-1 domain-containing protein n=1 Tax=Mytilus coruscus TaxID=42192 RepID=A0A6J8ALP1_MYTCO|nr:unnamed protein product [Mytilus coruscus]
MQDKHILLLYDGHRTHITPDIIDWAVEKKIILYVLPPHTSHVLQPIDVGCFGPFARIDSSECHKFQCTHSAVINNLCSTACKSNNSARSPSNLQSAFRKSGIYPLDRDAIDQSLFSISDAIHKQRQSEENTKVDDIPAIENETNEPVNLMSNSEINVETETILSNQENENIQIYVAEKNTDEKPDENTTFFTAKSTNLSKKNPPKQERRSIYKIVAGKAITEPETHQEIKDSTTTNKKLKQNQQDSQQPGPSGLHTIVVSDGSIADEDDQDDDTTLCCVCNMWQPKELQDCISIVFTQWAKCEFLQCDHWTHLKFCCDVSVLRRSDKFYCPYHGLPCKQRE